MNSGLPSWCRHSKRKISANTALLHQRHVDAVLRERREVHVFERRLRRRQAVRDVRRRRRASRRARRSSASRRSAIVRATRRSSASGPSASTAARPVCRSAPAVRLRRECCRCAMIAMRGHSSLTSSTMCVDRITTTSSPMRASRLWKRRRSAGSRPAVGSSTMISAGSPISACAMPKRCRMPPENVSRFLLRTSHRLVCTSSRSTSPRAFARDRRCPSESRGDSASPAASTRGYTPNSCGR